MFHQTRLKLTAWYLLILMVISILFSGVIYSIVSTQIGGLIHRQNDQIKHYQEGQSNDLDHQSRPHDGPPIITSEELQDQEQQLLLTLIVVNGIIFIVSGGAAYFLAGRTLRPIKYMIDEQNQFISSASHELRTPIATLRAEMETSLLEKHISDVQARKLIASNLEELGSLQNLTNNLLNLAQIHNNSHKFKEKISIPEIIDTAIKKVLPLAKKKQITLEKKVQEGMIVGEKGSLIETLVILLENAIKYSPEKTTITIATQKLRTTIKIMVVDDGIGIAPADLPHIFDRFYRADKSHTKEGFGLGLSIAKKTVESHKGTIHVTSIPKQGTTFSLTFPLKNS